MKIHSISKNIFVLVFITLLFNSCRKDEVQAERSLEGTWNVTAITSWYGLLDETSFNAEETIEESGQLGTFEFGATSVDFNFTRNDTLYTGSSTWELHLAKVQSGFFRVNEFTLEIDGEFTYDVTFEDATRNAERNANSLTFIEEQFGDPGVLIEMILEKQ